jgi:formylglycine-generating enzyme required for sulfatase activity
MMKHRLNKAVFPALCLLATLGMIFTGCSTGGDDDDDDGSVPVAVSGVSLNKSVTAIVVGSSETLIAIITPTDAANQNVNWSSNNESVATVSGGVVNAVSAGTAVITVTTEDGGYTATCTVTVTDYGISLDPPGPCTFPAAIVGYPTAPAAQTITVSNTGNQETGALTVALSGTNNSSFTLSTVSVNSIAAGGNDSFTVVPQTGLTEGTYTAMVTVSGGNGISADFTVSFMVNPPAPAYGINLDPPGPCTFPAAIVGYPTAPAAQIITVSNTGNQETGALTVALSGTNNSSFTLSTVSVGNIAVSGTGSFTVVPNTGLAIGMYTATVTVSGGNGISESFTVSFTVQLPAYEMKAVPAGTVSTGNTGSGNTDNWGAGANSAYTKPYSMSVFSIGETEITYELWYAVRTWAEGNGYTFANPGREGNDGTDGAAPTVAGQEPVTYISWRDAAVWCNAYSEAMGKTPVYKYNNAVLRESESNAVSAGSGKAELAVSDPAANGFRLPTEAQWEYAARGGVPSTSTPWTDTYAGSNTIDGVAVYATNSGSKTAAVKSKTANTLGLYDMSGNVFEWCQDVYTGTSRVVRGGSWGSGPSNCTAAYRYDSILYFLIGEFGFRVVCP